MVCVYIYNQYIYMFISHYHSYRIYNMFRYHDFTSSLHQIIYCIKLPPPKENVLSEAAARCNHFWDALENIGLWLRTIDANCYTFW